MEKYLVLDIGGTAIKYAVMTKEAEFLEKGNVKTPLDGIEIFIETIGQIYDKYKADINGVAISMPGVLDVDRGYAYSGGWLTFNSGQNIIELLQERCPLPITIENDAKCAALAELGFGSLKGCKDAAVIVLGTGVGGAIIIDGKVHKGRHSFAGEFSFMKTEASRMNECSSLWGLANGGPVLMQKVAEIKGLPLEEVNGLVTFELANNGDEEVLAVLDEFTQLIAGQIINIQCVVDPELVAIGGGISAQPLLIELIQKHLDAMSDNFGFYKPEVKVVPCQYRNDANLIGALYRFLTNK